MNEIEIEQNIIEECLPALTVMDKSKRAKPEDIKKAFNVWIDRIKQDSKFKKCGED